MKRPFSTTAINFKEDFQNNLNYTTKQGEIVLADDDVDSHSLI